MAKGLSKTCAGTFDYFMKSLKFADDIGADGAFNEIAKSSLTKKNGFMDIVSEISINGLLSGTGTPLINLVSGITQSLLMPTVRLMEGVVTTDSKILREALSMYSGSITGYTDFIPQFRRGFAKGMPLDIDVTDYKRYGMTKGQYNDMLQKMGLNENASAEEIRALMGDAYDYVNKAIPGPLGEVIRFPTRLLVGIDEGMKAVLRRQKFNAMAYRKALEETADNPRALSERFLQIRNQKLLGDEGVDAWKSVGSADNPDMQGLAPLLIAQNYAKMSIFQQELLGKAKSLQQFRSEFKPLMLMLPFFKTPYNILKEGLTFVPAVGYGVGRLAYRYADDMAVGGSVPMSRSEILARQSLGFGALATAWTLFDKGLITGTYPESAGERQMLRDSGIPELSIKTPMGWVSYQKIEPLSTVFGLISDLNRNIDNYFNSTTEVNAKDFDELVAASMWSLKNNIMGKSFMEGFANAINLLSLEASSAQNLSSAAAGIGRVVVPYGALLNNIARTMDSPDILSGQAYDRQATTFLEKMQQRIPGFRESLPFMYGVYGEKRMLNILDVWTGIRTADEVDRTELQQELGLLGIAYAPVDKSFKKGMKLDNEELARLRQLSAELATPILESYILSDGFQNLDESRKEKVFKDIMRKVRRGASTQFLAENSGNKNFMTRLTNAAILAGGLENLIGLDDPPEK